MQQRKLTGYRPKYPKKALRNAALTAAALVAMGGAAGCRDLMTSGEPMIPAPTAEELVLDGAVAIEEPTETPALQGKIAVTEPPEEPVTNDLTTTPDPGEEELVLDGDVIVPEPTEEELMLAGEPMAEEPTPEVPLRTTGVLLMPTATPEA